MPKTNKNSKGYSLRKVNIREIKQRFLIACQGEKTDPNYFRSFRIPTVTVKMISLAYNPIKLVQETNVLKKEDDYNQVWCVFDRDDSPKQDFNSAISSANSSNIQVAYSNEAFELWYVLHFEFLCTGIPRDDYSKKLTSLLGKKYEKNSTTIYNDLLDKQDIAIKRAKKLLEEYKHSKPEQDNPSTTVHLLVEQLNRFAR